MLAVLHTQNRLHKNNLSIQKTLIKTHNRKNLRYTKLQIYLYDEAGYFPRGRQGSNLFFPEVRTHNGQKSTDHPPSLVDAMDDFSKRATCTVIKRRQHTLIACKNHFSSNEECCILAVFLNSFSQYPQINSSFHPR